jgi:alpha-tubulin suppressor-like RCC1 family protein
MLAGPDACGASTPAAQPCTVCIKDISLGNKATCVLMHHGSIACVDFNPYGELGTGKTDPPEVPLTPPVLTPATAQSGITVSSMQVGFDFTCVLAAPSQGSNKVYCLGANYNGQLGNGKHNQ